MQETIRPLIAKIALSDGAALVLNQKSTPRAEFTDVIRQFGMWREGAGLGIFHALSDRSIEGDDLEQIAGGFERMAAEALTPWLGSPLMTRHATSNEYMGSPRFACGDEALYQLWMGRAEDAANAFLLSALSAAETAELEESAQPGAEPAEPTRL